MSAADTNQQSTQQASQRTATQPRSDITVIILSYNEVVNLPHALASVQPWADKVFVVDSGSNDGSIELARARGAVVVHQDWLGYARQKNWALANLPIETSWVFILDADEAITPELRDELLATSARGGAAAADGYYINRLTYFLGKPIKRCGYFPSYNLRFFRKGKARYEEREVHEHMIVDGRTDRLRFLMLHEDRRGLEHFIAKHNRYSTLEARELTREQVLQRSDAAGPLETGIATRRWLKRNILPKLPFSGLWRFLYMYFIRFGFLDGVTGFRFCIMLAMYDTFISLKMAELRAKGLAVGLGRADVTVPKKADGLAVAEGAVVPLPLSQLAATKDAPNLAPSLQNIDTAVGVQPPVAEAAPAVVALTPVATTPAAPAVAQPAKPAQGPKVEAPVLMPDGTEWAPRSWHPDTGPLPDPRHPDADKLARELDPLRMPSSEFPAARSVKVSILVPVKNEQRHMVDCLRRCQWATELVVVDSKSTDKTIPMAQAMGADVYQFFYDRSTGWPKKKNWALESVPWKNEWVMILDADEYMTPELAQEIRRVVEGSWKPQGRYAQAGCGDGYWVNRRFMFMGKWIRGCGFYPSWNVRLLKHKLGRYERIGSLGDTGSGDNEVHEHIVLSTGKAGYLSNEFLHYAYPDLAIWVEKHNRYTTWEAHAMEAKDEGAVRASIFGEPIERRRWLKAKARKLPFRPTLRFLYSFFAQRGFLDGYPGFVMCRLLAWYEFMSIAKYREMVVMRSDRTKQASLDVSGKPR
jgi:glycosyltransferase involved in cell wall biosynthesis